MAKPNVSPQQRKILAFHSDLLACYNALAELEDHTLPPHAADREEHHRRGPCYTLAQALAEALAELTPEDRELIRGTLNQVPSFVDLSYKAITTGF